MIKREFYRDEKIGELVPPARLLFISTWIQADDSVNCAGDTRVLRSEAFPFDDDISSATVDGWISDMEKLGLVERYQVSDQKYLHITNFLRHQVIDRPSQFRYPVPSQRVLVESSPNAQRAHDEHSVLKVKVKSKSKAKEKVKANGNGDSHDRSLDQLPKRPCAKESEDAWTYTGMVRSRIDERFFAAGQFEAFSRRASRNTKPSRTFSRKASGSAVACRPTRWRPQCLCAPRGGLNGQGRVRRRKNGCSK